MISYWFAETVHIFHHAGWQPTAFGVNMNLIARLIVCLFILFGWGDKAVQFVLAQEQSPDPVISLTVKDEPLIDALDTIAQQTGYEFGLTPQWEDHPVSATINNLPLEQGLKRLLRSLNHTILWEADNMVIIKVYGKVASGVGGGISFSAPPQEYREKEEPFIEPDNEPLDESDETSEGDQESQPESPDEPDRERDGEADERPNITGQRKAVPVIEE